MSNQSQDPQPNQDLPEEQPEPNQDLPEPENPGGTEPIKTPGRPESPGKSNAAHARRDERADERAEDRSERAENKRDK